MKDIDEYSKAWTTTQGADCQRKSSAPSGELDTTADGSTTQIAKQAVADTKPGAMRGASGPGERGDSKPSGSGLAETPSTTAQAEGQRSDSAPGGDKASPSTTQQAKAQMGDSKPAKSPASPKRPADQVGPDYDRRQFEEAYATYDKNGRSKVSA